MVNLYPHQLSAIDKMHNGCILVGGVGSGKSITSLAYYMHNVCHGTYFEASDSNMKDLYVITTARKRDSHEWERDMCHFLLSTNKEAMKYSINVIVDSWNNVHKYSDVENAFFIFDEQRVVGSGSWSKTFIKIAKKNEWILLSATPGDTWTDYIPVFIANGFYRNRSQFVREHVVFSRFAKYPKIQSYMNVDKLSDLRSLILVPMKFERDTIPHRSFVGTRRDEDLYRATVSTLKDPYSGEPLMDAGGLCRALRKIVNSDESRPAVIRQLMKDHPKVIIFYNYNYELEILRNLSKENRIPSAEWNGEKHEPVPKCDKWMYLVQYTAGAEGWNCIDTDTIIFYSLNYSYKIMTQAAGRIDRLNTPFTDLYYYYLVAPGIDQSIRSALGCKKKFNEEDFYRENI